MLLVHPLWYLAAVHNAFLETQFVHGNDGGVDGVVRLGHHRDYFFVDTPLTVKALSAFVGSASQNNGNNYRHQDNGHNHHDQYPDPRRDGHVLHMEDKTAFSSWDR